MFLQLRRCATSSENAEHCANGSAQLLLRRKTSGGSEEELFRAGQTAGARRRAIRPALLPAIPTIIRHLVLRRVADILNIIFGAPWQIVARGHYRCCRNVRLRGIRPLLT